MPKMKPDRDDSRGGLDGNGGPQRGPTGGGDDHQRRDTDVAGTGDGELGQGGQRNPGGSSRDE